MMEQTQIEPQMGDHLVSPRSMYTHHGIYMGDGNVIHYSGLADGLDDGPIEETTLELFSNGNDFTIQTYTDPVYTDREIVDRARSRLGEDLYNVYSNNCEHFCLWCINGTHDSEQVSTGTTVAGGTAVTLMGVAARSVVLTEAIAATGAVGTGAAVGLGVLSTAPGLGAAYVINNTILKNSPVFDEPEKDARSVGRMASYAGATVSSVGGIAAVSASGSVAGLSGAGIASGLTALGGGSIAGGAALVVAGPMVATAFISYGAYRLIKHFKE